LLDRELKTVQGSPVIVLHPGDYNTDGGPAFFNARVQIGNTIWAGNVEIHLKASDWYRHHHQDDDAYNNVILHVVETYDAEVYGIGFQPVPTLEVKNRFSLTLLNTYRKLSLTRRWIPCESMIDQEITASFSLWAPSLATERLIRISRDLDQFIRVNDSGLAETMFLSVARALGFSINSHPFELLVKSIPFSVLIRHRDQIMSLEAILFGQSGLLPAESGEPYPTALQREYHCYAGKYGLNPIAPGTWKFLRMRPGNFPTIRISQLAALICRPDSLLMMDNWQIPLENWLSGFQATASSYWDTHYTFDKLSVARIKRIGVTSARLLIINGVAPFLFLLGNRKDLRYHEMSLSLLEQIPPEENATMPQWEQTGLVPKNALETQALKELKTNYCNLKRCLSCRLGYKILNQSIHHETHLLY